MDTWVVSTLGFITKNAAMNIRVHIFIETYVFNALECIHAYIYTYVKSSLIWSQKASRHALYEVMTFK